MSINDNICILCSGSEQNYTPSEDCNIICSKCTQVLISSTQEQILAAYNKAVKLQKTDAINFLSKLIEDKENGEDIKRDMDRERTGRATRVAHN